ncbi:uncharacterized protein LOC134259136 [Saccostrea cucullata]|uniref:uncharacterized protein LOC134259136 n=1 Tax=Saccostrea cuccullata TaxID=36930 RepID=UPI002ED39B69
MEAPPPSYQEAVNSEPSTSSFTIYPSQSSPESTTAGGHVAELCVCPQHGIVPRLNVCICGRDGLQSGAIQTTSCQHCSNYVIVQRHYLNTHTPISDSNNHSRNEISEERSDQSGSNDVSVHFDSAKGTVSSLISEPEREPMLSDANRLTESGEDEEETEGACANCNTGSFCAASFLAIFVIILITVFTFYLT